jgi:hypothetical protein
MPWFQFRYSSERSVGNIVPPQIVEVLELPDLETAKRYAEELRDREVQKHGKAWIWLKEVDRPTVDIQTNEPG